MIFFCNVELYGFQDIYFLIEIERFYFFFSLLLSGQRINSDDGSVESIVFQSRSSDLNEKMSAVAANGLPVGRIAERPANLDNI